MCLGFFFFPKIFIINLRNNVDGFTHPGIPTTFSTTVVSCPSPSTSSRWTIIPNLGLRVFRDRVCARVNAQMHPHLSAQICARREITCVGTKIAWMRRVSALGLVLVCPDPIVLQGAGAVFLSPIRATGTYILGCVCVCVSLRPDLG